MGIYSKEVFGGVLTPINGDQGTATACGNHDASCPIASAVIETIIEGYIAFSASIDNITSIDQAKQFASTFTKEMIDNGELTNVHLEHIQTWIGQHHQIFSGRYAACMPCEKKLMGKILENCDASECPEIAEVQRLKAQLCAAKAKALAKYGPAICKEVTCFLQRYGRSMDQTYVKAWTDMCGATPTTSIATATDSNPTPIA